MREDELPSWILNEIAHPVPPGQGANNQAIRWGPSAIRAGLKPEQLSEIFQRIYPVAPEREIDMLVRNSCSMAETEFKPNERSGELKEMTEAATRALPMILQKYDITEITSDTQDLPLGGQRRLFLSTLFGPDDRIWIGEKFSSGPNFAHCFQTRSHWIDKKFIKGEFVSHCSFKEGVTSRSNDSVEKNLFMVVESDTLLPHELLSVAEHLQQHHELPLRAIISTGGKRHGDLPGLHFWFTWPGNHDDWAAVLQGYQCDPSTLRGSQPVRLPGTIRRDTGRPQELLWLKQN